MTVTQTSIDAFVQIGREGLSGQCVRLVYAAILRAGDEGVTDREIARDCELQINNVTGRRNELVKLRMVVRQGYKQCPITGRIVANWVALPPTSRPLIQDEDMVVEVH